ncbi:hypothetical protein NQZ68_039797, partial [Dissostichus eleginoides]
MQQPVYGSNIKAVTWQARRENTTNGTRRKHIFNQSAFRHLHSCRYNKDCDQSGKCVERFVALPPRTSYIQ